MWLKYEAKANKRLACHNESRGPLAGRQCESIPSLIHLCSRRGASVPQACAAGINFGPRRGDGDSVWSRTASFSPAVSSEAPRGTPRRICMPLAVRRKFIIVASQLPQQQLGGLFKPKWCLRAVGRRIGKAHAVHARAHTHTPLVFLARSPPSGEKAASNSNHGDQNTAVSRHRVTPLMKCRPVFRNRRAGGDFSLKLCRRLMPTCTGSSWQRLAWPPLIVADLCFLIFHIPVIRPSSDIIG